MSVNAKDELLTVPPHSPTSPDVISQHIQSITINGQDSQPAVLAFLGESIDHLLTTSGTKPVRLSQPCPAIWTR